MPDICPTNVSIHLNLRRAWTNVNDFFQMCDFIAQQSESGYSNLYFWWPDEVQIHSQGLCGIIRSPEACVHFTHIFINCSNRSEVLRALLLKFYLMGCYAVLVGKELPLLGRTCKDFSHCVNYMKNQHVRGVLKKNSVNV